MTMCPREIHLSALFQNEGAWTSQRAIRTAGAQRDEHEGNDGEQMILDRFTQSGVRCGFLRLLVTQVRRVRIATPGSYGVLSCNAGGWLLEPDNKNDVYYWIPQVPIVRSMTSTGHIIKEFIGQAKTFHISSRSVSLELDIPDGCSLDLVAWEIPSQEREIIHGLSELTTLEAQPVFLWGSHAQYQRPADVYQHLIFGQVYETRYLWPYYRKCYSENDAHALYVTLSGLQRATGKKLYTLLKEQLLLSILARQATDGGWYHGEWSEDMEAHLRLNGSAIHLLLSSLEERDEPVVRQALERAVSFVSRHKDETLVGAWLLHDALELSVDGMNKSPFKWARSGVLGKSPSNMLVLNTHLDALVLLERYHRVTGDGQYSELVQSAKSAARAVLNLRPFEAFYRLVFPLIRLNLLPVQVQRRLPLPLRLVKRLVRKWLTPNFFRVTARFPRLVMPGGYIGRAIALQGMADSYHSINVMDLARYSRCYQDEHLSEVINDAVAFVDMNDILTHWGENEGSKYAVGFWAEALYHLYLLAPARDKLSKLAGVICKIEEIGIGLPPSLFGANAEAVPLGDQTGCLSPSDGRIKVANLSRKDHAEFLVVNPTTIPLQLSWETSILGQFGWKSHTGDPIENESDIKIPARSWIVGHQQMTRMRVNLNAITLYSRLPSSLRL